MGCQSEAYLGRNGSTFGVREEEVRGATWVLSPQDKKCAQFIFNFSRRKKISVDALVVALWAA